MRILSRNTFKVYIFILFSLVHLCAKAETTSLYARIGGYDAISTFSGGLIDGFYSDPRFNRFTQGAIPAVSVIERDKQLTTEYLCKITGGPCYYIGKIMLAVHKDLKITQDEWNALIDHATRLANDLDGIKDGDKKEFLKLFDRISLVMNIQNDS